MKNPDIRRLRDMKEVLYDKKWAKTASNLELYYMHRSVKEKDGLRYDITVIPPKMLGQEFVKTKGHNHSDNFGEIYQVLAGEALYLIQKNKNKRVGDIFAIRAKKGQWTIIPPGFGHVTINPTKKTLKEANWIAKDCQNVYEPFSKNQGACYFYTKSGWVKNKKYKAVPKLRFKKPLNKIPKNLDFLYGR